LLNYADGVIADVCADARLDTLGRVGTAMADGVRRRILVRLLDGPAYPAELAEEMGESRANVSNHLACLRGCGLVRATREGRQMRYDLADRKLARALRLLAEIDLVVEPGHADLGGRS
jgi:ArsR family transcriptional regulator, cadmium/lead-responsive transcriptional repressor